MNYILYASIYVCLSIYDGIIYILYLYILSKMNYKLYPSI